MTSPPKWARNCSACVHGKAENSHVDIIAAEGMAARAERQGFAEEEDRHVIAAGAPVGPQRNLMRPIAVDHSFAEFAFAVDHGASH
jgi:hypothetical protein